ncbi:MAG: hypothetical protein OEL80_05760, partial [Desulfuromonadales bacterium]|nr:hypothetical protein [Desulfuromonadales bacterium]
MPDGGKDINADTVEGRTGTARIDAWAALEASAFTAYGAVAQGEGKVMPGQKSLAFKSEGDIVGDFLAGRMDDASPAIMLKDLLYS